MYRRFVLFLLCAWLWPQAMFAQVQPVTEEHLSERNQGFAFGGHFHTGGLGFDGYFFRKLPKGFTGFATVSLASQRENKEVRIRSLYADQGGKDFIYDKKNHAYSLSLTVGLQTHLVKLNNYNKLSVQAGIGIGPNLAILKPYYVEVAVPINATQARVELFPYDAERFGFSDIVGRGNYFMGFDGLQFVPGLRLRAFSTVNLAGSTLYIRAIHLGATLDAFSRPLDIMDMQPDRSLFLNLYFGVLLGNAW